MYFVLKIFDEEGFIHYLFGYDSLSTGTRVYNVLIT